MYTGTLCGECEPGFTELAFTAQCVADEQCNPASFWITYIFMGLVYVILGMTLTWVTLWGSRPRSRSGPDPRVTFSGQNVEVETVSDTAQLTQKDNATTTDDNGEFCSIPEIVTNLCKKNCRLVKFYKVQGYLLMLTIVRSNRNVGYI